MIGAHGGQVIDPVIVDGMTPFSREQFYDLYRRNHPRGAVDPTPPQGKFINSTELEALFVSANGTGKSTGLLLSALLYSEFSSYKGIILTSGIGQLYDFVSLARAYLPISLFRQRPAWAGFSGAKVAFDYLDNERDVEWYQGASYHFIGLDGLTNFTRYQYTYLFSRLRKEAGDTIPLRMRATDHSDRGDLPSWVTTRFGGARPDAVRINGDVPNPFLVEK